MAKVHLRETWTGVIRPVEDLKPGDVMVIRGAEFTVKDRFRWPDTEGIDRVVYVVVGEGGNEYTLWSHELERMDGEVSA